MASLLSKVSSAVAACARRVSRATRRLFRARRLCQGGSLGRQHVAAAQGGGTGTGVGEGEGGEGLWRRAILMGKRCEPLNFAGAIHYDSLGRRIAQPRGKAKAAAMLCRSSSDAVDEAVTASKKAR